ncbi:MAG: electron transfer flavoprotein subunit alpha/FixB family protein [Actinomycetota bacterium]
MTTVWVYAPVTSEGAHPGAFELLTKARSLGDQVAAVALGPGARGAAGDLGAHGAAIVYASDDPVFAEHPGRPAARVLSDLVSQHHPSLILFPATYDARDVAGRLQAHTGSTLMSNATDVLGPDRVRTEIFGGAKIVDVRLEGAEPRLVLVRPRSLPAEPTGGTAEVVPVEVTIPEALKAARVTEHHEEAAAGPKLEEAKVVVAGGRGLGGPDAFAILDDRAAASGGAGGGASRAAVDAGWVPYSFQIGQTGKTVKPEIYLAVGISGALQHVVGMKGAKRIVAINKDAEAPILKMADLGVVGDLFDVVPKLAEEIRRRRADA